MTEAKLRSNFFLTDLPPGKGAALTGKSAKGVALAGEDFPRQQAHAPREPSYTSGQSSGSSSSTALIMICPSPPFLSVSRWRSASSLRIFHSWSFSSFQVGQR